MKYLPIAIALVLLSNNIHASQKGVACLAEGKKQETIGNREGKGNRKAFQKALSHYLCAANDGIPEGAQLAADLSLSGQAPQLPRDTLEKLYRQSAQGGIVEGFFGLAGLSCGDASLIECNGNPVRALNYLFEAKKAGSKAAAFRIGKFLLKGFGTMPDTVRAYACFKEASGVGAERLQKEILANHPDLQTNGKCEVAP